MASPIKAVDDAWECVALGRACITPEAVSPCSAGCVGTRAPMQFCFLGPAQMQHGSFPGKKAINWATLVT